MSNSNGLKKYHFVYKTTNLINEKYYIGIHSTKNINDGYLGSGKKLLLSVKKYGPDNFKLEILEFVNTRELLVEREKEIIDSELLKDPKCMNLRPGGTGGWNREEQVAGAIKSNIKQKWLKENNKEWLERKKGLLDGSRKPIKSCDWTGKRHSVETILKFRESRKGTGFGSENSQFGTIWITNGKENKKIKKDNVIPDGWNRGRKMGK